MCGVVGGVKHSVHIKNYINAPVQKTARPHIVDVHHYRYRDGEGREFTEYFIRFSDDSGCYFRKPKTEIYDEAL